MILTLPNGCPVRAWYALRSMSSWFTPGALHRLLAGTSVLQKLAAFVEGQESTIWTMIVLPAFVT